VGQPNKKFEQEKKRGESNVKYFKKMDKR